MSDLPSVVDVAWLREQLGEPDVVVGDVRGPNAHARGHIPGSRPLVLGSPPPMSDPETVQALASEVGLRLRRHGITGEERLVLYDRGDGIGAMPSAQLAELAGHPRVAVLMGGLAAWGEPLEVGPFELQPVKATFEPRLDALPTRDELARRLDDPSLVLLDVRTPEEFSGRSGYPCDQRQGHIPGARHTLIRAGRPQTNGAVEALHRLILEECWRPAFARYLHVRFTGLKRDLEQFVDGYNFDRPHHGRLTQGRIPADIVYPGNKMKTAR